MKHKSSAPRRSPALAPAAALVAVFALGLGRLWRKRRQVETRADHDSATRAAQDEIRATHSAPETGPGEATPETTEASGPQITVLELALPMSLIALQPIGRFAFGYRHLDRLRKALMATMLITGHLKGRARRQQGAERAGSERPGSDRHGFVLEPRRPQRYLVALLAWTLTSYLASDESRKHPRTITHRIWLTLVLNHFHSLSRREPVRNRTFVRAIVFAAAANGLLATLQYLSIERGVLSILTPLIIPKVDRDRKALGTQYGRYISWGTFNHPNLLGVYLGMTVPLAVAYSLSERNRVQLITAAPILLGLKYSASRGGKLNALVGCAYMALHRKITTTAPEDLKKPYRRALQGTLLLAALIYRYPHWFIALANALPNRSETSTGLSNREVIWHNTMQMLAERPLLGTGTGAYSREYLERFGFPSFIERASAEQEMSSLGRHDLADNWHAHNFFINTAAESGLPAAALAGLFFTSYLLGQLSDATRFDPAEATEQELRDSWLVSGCSAAIAGNFVHSFFDSPCNLDYPPIGFAFMTLMALGAER